MPNTEVRAFCEPDETSPLLDWLKRLGKLEPRARTKCLYLIAALGEHGRTLKMPLSKPLRDGIIELRSKVGRVNFRMLYAFIGLRIAVISHGITKEGKVPDGEIDLAINRVNLVKTDPAKYTAEIDI